MEVSEARALGMKTVLKTSERFPPASVIRNRSATFTGASTAADTANASAEATARVFASTSVSSSAIPETRPAEDVASLAASSSRHSARDRTRRPLGVAVRSARDAATDADEDAALGRRARGGRADAAAVAAAAAHDATIDMVAWRRGSLCAGKSTTFIRGDIVSIEGPPSRVLCQNPPPGTTTEGPGTGTRADSKKNVSLMTSRAISARLSLRPLTP